jgi:hypothetical protein
VQTPVQTSVPRTFGPGMAHCSPTQGDPSARVELSSSGGRPVPFPCGCPPTAFVGKSLIGTRETIQVAYDLLCGEGALCVSRAVRAARTVVADDDVPV